MKYEYNSVKSPALKPQKVVVKSSSASKYEYHSKEAEELELEGNKVVKRCNKTIIIIVITCCVLTAVGITLGIVFGIVLVSRHPCVREIDTSCADTCAQRLMDVYNNLDELGPGSSNVQTVSHPDAVVNVHNDSRTTPYTARDAWAKLDVIQTWNVWGLAPMVLVRDEESIDCAFLDIVWNRPFKWRQASDARIQRHSTRVDSPTFFAIAMFQEAFDFGRDACECVTVKDGFVSYQDRIFRAQEAKKNTSALIDKWVDRKGTRETFPQYTGTGTAFVDHGLMIMSTHTPFAFGFEEFTNETNQQPDVISRKGMIWACWKNQDSSKGVCALNLHASNWEEQILQQYAQLDVLISVLAVNYSSQVGCLDIYVAGDFNLRHSILAGFPSIYSMKLMTPTFSNETGYFFVDRIYGTTIVNGSVCTTPGCFDDTGCDTHVEYVPTIDLSSGEHADPISDISDHPFVTVACN